MTHNNLKEGVTSEKGMTKLSTDDLIKLVKQNKEDLRNGTADQKFLEMLQRANVNGLFPLERLLFIEKAVKGY